MSPFKPSSPDTAAALRERLATLAQEADASSLRAAVAVLHTLSRPDSIRESRPPESLLLSPDALRERLRKAAGDTERFSLTEAVDAYFNDSASARS